MKRQFSPVLVLPLVALAFSLAGTANAQEKKDDRNRALRVIAVGEAPPWEEKIVERDGRKFRLQQDPPEGSVPPYYVQVVNKEGAEEGDPIPLTLNRMSGVVAVRGGIIPLHESGEGGLAGSSWHKLKYPGTARAGLAILWRDPQVKKWSKARSWVLRDDTTAFRAGTVRIINISGVPVGLDVDGKKGQLPHGKIFPAATKGGKLNLKVNVKTTRGWREVADQVVEQSTKERTNVIIYRADGEAPRRPVNALVLREPARTPAVPKKRKTASTP